MKGFTKTETEVTKLKEITSKPMRIDSIYFKKVTFHLKVYTVVSFKLEYCVKTNFHLSKQSKREQQFQISFLFDIIIFQQHQK